MQNFSVDGGVARGGEQERIVPTSLDGLEASINPNNVARDTLKRINDNPDLSNSAVIRIFQDAIRALQSLGSRGDGSRRFEALAGEGRLMDRQDLRTGVRNDLVSLGRSLGPAARPSAIMGRPFPAPLRGGPAVGPAAFGRGPGGPIPAEIPDRMAGRLPPDTVINVHPFDIPPGNRHVLYTGLSPEDGMEAWRALNAPGATTQWHIVDIEAISMPDGRVNYVSLFENGPSLHKHNYPGLSEEDYAECQEYFAANGYVEILHSPYIENGVPKHWAVWSQVPGGPMTICPPPPLLVASPVPVAGSLLPRVPPFRGFTGPIPVTPVVRGGPVGPGFGPPPGPSFRGPGSGPRPGGIGFPSASPGGPGPETRPGFVGGPGVIPSGIDRGPRG